jgi:hypothetical protein
MTESPQNRVSHLRDGFIVARVGIEQSETVSAPSHLAQRSKVEVDH